MRNVIIIVDVIAVASIGDGLETQIWKQDITTA